jgi:LysR family transcriptional regulator, glycine cleavage system transcriptional activator
MRRLPPLTALRAFEAAARHMSFKAAANELRLTPTAISHQVRPLENILSCPLFRRRPRPLRLTPAGAALFPIIRNSFDSIDEALSGMRGGVVSPRLRVTTTNAFAGRWLLPRLPLWQAAHPEITMEVIGTDAVLNVMGGDADVAVRYSPGPPVGITSIEFLRDRFWPVASASLLGSRSLNRPSDVVGYPLIHSGWPEANPNAPTLSRWAKAAHQIDKQVPQALAGQGLLFSEELHAIDAVIAGQGIGLLSDVLVEQELARGELLKVLNFSLPGFGFYLIYARDNPRRSTVDRFLEWIVSVR